MMSAFAFLIVIMVMSAFAFLVVIMMMSAFAFLVVIMVMSAFTFLIVVMMMSAFAFLIVVMMMSAFAFLVVIMVMRQTFIFLHQLFHQFLLFHRFQNLRAADRIPWGRNDDRFRVLFPDQRQAFRQFFFTQLLCPA